VAGLGLEGGSMAKALKQHTDHLVYGWNRTTSVAEQALADGAIDGIADDEILAKCDLLIAVLYPEATIDYLKRVIPLMKEGAQVVDMVGIKSAVVSAVAPVALAHGVHYCGGHPMSGQPKAGYGQSYADLFKGASMILVPTDATAEGDVEHLGELFRQVGFGRIKVCDAQTHDRMIAHTSQLSHVVSNCYVKSPSSPNHKGFSAGSYRDMIRVAGVNEVLWTDLFLTNRDALLGELDTFIGDLLKVRKALAEENADEMQRLLREGRIIREAIVE
jgi:prephenate dehydrogenase